jgi:hypothetical protein
MNLFSLILDAGVVLLAGGIFLAGYAFLTGLTEVALRVWKRLFVSWASRRMQEMGILKTDKGQKKARLDVKRLILFLSIPCLALLVNDLLLSPLVVFFGLLVIWWIDFQSRRTERDRVNEDAEMAALQMRSLLNIDHSILNALNGIELPEGVLKRSVQQVINRLQMHQQPEEAAQSLKGLPGTVTARLSALIAHSSKITDAVQSSLLIALEEETHRQKLLRSKMRQTMALVRGTIRLLQGVTAAAMVFVLLSPTWRNFFLRDIPHRTLLTVLLTCAILGSLYFEYEVYQLGSAEAF